MTRSPTNITTRTTGHPGSPGNPGHPGGIHPSAIVEPGAQIAPDATIGPMCYVGAKAVVGAGTRLISNVTILGRTTLGQNNTVWPYAVLGGDPQDLKFHGEDAQLVIGDNNDIRESVTMHIGTDNGGGFTRVGSDNLIMVGAHIAHDCIVGSHVIIANGAQLAGHIHVHDNATLSGLVAVHHFVTIGRYAYVGGMTRVVRDVPPFTLFEGNPGRARALNVIGLQRHRFAPDSIAHLKDAFRRLFRDAVDDDQGEPQVQNLADRLHQIEHDYPDDECVMTLARFMRNTAIGLHGRHLEATRHDNRHTNPTR